jgi:uncharacterized protein (TIGR03790 family)
MAVRAGIVFFVTLACCGGAFALEPNEIVIIANSEVPASVRVAHYYCKKRSVPAGNIVSWPLGPNLTTKIGRAEYETKLAEPLRSRLNSRQFAGKVRCLLPTYGVPITVGDRGQLPGQEDKLKQLQERLEQEKTKLEQLNKPDAEPNKKEVTAEAKAIEARVAELQGRIDRILGKETSASVDSELSMVLFRNYELYRWQPNRLMRKWPHLDFNTLMVCRLDGPTEDIVLGLIDKAIAAERTGLTGNAYIDTRGRKKDNVPYSFGYFDQSLRDLALLLRFRTHMPVKEESTEKLFGAGECPATAIYCGWYSLTKYVDAFDFVDGAVGYHISSLEATQLRDINSTQWCPAMLRDGITATLGAVAEPYLHSFPEPKAFFLELLDGRCLVEAFYASKPFNSWRLVLIGDPLYRPFSRIAKKY